jgi:hypothetical protein
MMADAATVDEALTLCRSGRLLREVKPEVEWPTPKHLG